MTSLVPSIALIASFLALLLGVFLLVLPSASRLANALLALFLIATAVDISGWFLAEWWATHPEIARFRAVIAMLQMPWFVGFIWFNCFQRHRLHWHDGLHALPAAFVLILTWADVDMPYLRAVFEFQYVAYIAAAIYALWKVRHQMKTRFVGQSTTWRWLSLLVASSLLARGLFVFRTGFSSTMADETLVVLQAVAAFLVLCITVWIAFQALLYPQMFRGADKLMASAAKEMDEPEQFDDDRLMTFMADRRPYLDPDLSLTRLARQIGVTVKDLSAEINLRHGLHFFDFINRYRVEHAQRLLVETDQSVIEIYLASGFNAKSSFNTAFRKHAGTTPSAYRRERRK
ncbi:MAG: helix-turn-helix domain-containing protein [Erythrobacter sp.]